jgi:hypothetical protein
MLPPKACPEDSQFVIGHSSTKRRSGRSAAARRSTASVSGRPEPVARCRDRRRVSVVARDPRIAGRQDRLPGLQRITRAARQLNAAKSLYGVRRRLDVPALHPRRVQAAGAAVGRVRAADRAGRDDPDGAAEGVKNLVESRLAASAARDMGDEELGHLSAAVAKVMGGANKVLGDPDKTEFVST